MVFGLWFLVSVIVKNKKQRQKTDKFNENKNLT